MQEIDAGKTMFRPQILSSWKNKNVAITGNYCQIWLTTQKMSLAVAKIPLLIVPVWLIGQPNERSLLVMRRGQDQQFCWFSVLFSGINECDVNSTLCNSGQCIDRFGGYSCSCPAGSHGSHCEKSKYTQCLIFCRIETIWSYCLIRFCKRHVFWLQCQRKVTVTG